MKILNISICKDFSQDFLTADLVKLFSKIKTIIQIHELEVKVHILSAQEKSDSLK